MIKTNRNFNIEMKNNVVVILGLILVIGFIIMITSNNGDSKKNENIYDSQMLQQFMNIGFTNEQAQNSVNIIKKIGINTITGMEQTENTITAIGSDIGYPKQEEANIVYKCKGNDDTQYECEFLIFIKDNEIVHVCYYGYGSKTTYYRKDNGVVRKTVHPYTDA